MVTNRQCTDFVQSMMLPNPDTFLEEVIEWIRANLSPDDVFNARELEDWAENNGFVEEE